MNKNKVTCFRRGIAMALTAVMLFSECAMGVSAFSWESYVGAVASEIVSEIENNADVIAPYAEMLTEQAEAIASEVVSEVVSGVVSEVVSEVVQDVIADTEADSGENTEAEGEVVPEEPAVEETEEPEEPTLYEALMAAETLQEMFDLLMADVEVTKALTEEDLTAVQTHADELFAALEEPTEEEQGYYAEINHPFKNSTRIEQRGY